MIKQLWMSNFKIFCTISHTSTILVSSAGEIELKTGHSEGALGAGEGRKRERNKRKNTNLVLSLLINKSSYLHFKQNDCTNILE